ncbi:hypothetical protein ABEB36_001854 [Hypothenemus hampei]|uniref:Enkurin domain-containing protein n=1 Tax=Hypothenemus hampei TaxID=57062 RepID=A0ABD1FJH8_HYPHA
MSIILITDHDEIITDITKTHSDFKKKYPRYKRKCEGDTSSTNGKCERMIQNHATMGLPEIEPPDPHGFLRKGTGRPSYTLKKTINKDEHLCRKMKLKFDTPLAKELIEAFKCSERKMRGKRTDFVKDNVKSVVQMKPKEPELRRVTDQMGTISYPQAQGLLPVYIKKRNFGKTPNYLINFKKSLETDRQLNKNLSSNEHAKCRYITKDERNQVLNGLRKNWKELQDEYQLLPILTDTITKRMKKSKLEMDLKQLEHDIALLERHPYIFIYDDVKSQVDGV